MRLTLPPPPDEDTALRGQKATIYYKSHQFGQEGMEFGGKVN